MSYGAELITTQLKDLQAEGGLSEEQVRDIAREEAEDVADSLTVEISR